MAIKRPTHDHDTRPGGQSRLDLIPDDVRQLAGKVKNMKPTWYAGRLTGEANGHRRVEVARKQADDGTSESESGSDS
jgi:hypothetical protein